ncbi:MULTISPECIES: COG4223 family protein [Halocynthiibacter]|uniref:Mitochondrial inner membrane protein n=1 Tax=Halocynthiibacter halioticoli TaxID=2986804 RepID=A0AAE3J3A2_9RHOB|nr:MULTISPECIES: hypothetical protein [Halocynthiibacter]MCV6825646.1 hypothetical protein [Halocynthiibacter halioticoli]MCW4058647.1 hypothetical protein [Halocynthiibacter sp. SDUM655004]
MANEDQENKETLKLGEPIPDAENQEQSDEKIEDAEVVETEDTAKEEPETAEEKPGSSEKPTSGTGFFPLLIGGLAAGAIGFGAAYFLPKEDSQLDEVVARISTNESAFDKHVAQLEQSQSTLAEQLANKAAASELTAVSDSVNSNLAELRSELDAFQVPINDAISALEARITEIEKRPISDNAASSAAVSAYERELTAMREMLEAQRTQIEAVAKDAETRIAEAQAQAESLKQGAEAAANATLMRAALMRIEAAFESGAAFDVALQDLAKATNIEPSAELLAASTSGIAPLTTLQAEFPAAARDALNVTAAETSGEGVIDKMGAFLKSQTGARSLTPSEGTSPDAILSRAEASLRAGDLTGALSEISTLPETGQQAMAEWIDAATYRNDILQAVRTLVESAAQN